MLSKKIWDNAFTLTISPNRLAFIAHAGRRVVAGVGQQMDDDTAQSSHRSLVYQMIFSNYIIVTVFMCCTLKLPQNDTPVLISLCRRIIWPYCSVRRRKEHKYSAKRQQRLCTLLSGDYFKFTSCEVKNITIKCKLCTGHNQLSTSVTSDRSKHLIWKHFQ